MYKERGGRDLCKCVCVHTSEEEEEEDGSYCLANRRFNAAAIEMMD